MLSFPTVGSGAVRQDWKPYWAEPGSLLNYMGANPKDFTGSVPKITILSVSCEPGCSVSVGEDLGHTAALLPAKTAWEGACQNGFGDLFLVYVLITECAEPAIMEVIQNSWRLTVSCRSLLLIIFQRGHSGVNYRFVCLINRSNDPSQGKEWVTVPSPGSLDYFPKQMVPRASFTWNIYLLGHLGMWPSERLLTHQWDGSTEAAY